MKTENTVNKAEKIMKLSMVIFTIVDFGILSMGAMADGGLVSNLMVKFGILGAALCGVQWAIFRNRLKAENVKSDKAAWALMCVCLAPVIVSHGLSVYLMNKSATHMWQNEQDMQAKMWSIRHELEHLGEQQR